MAIMYPDVRLLSREVSSGALMWLDSLMSGMSNGLDAGGVSILIEFMDSALINRPI
jgi:hypothetical protein